MSIFIDFFLINHHYIFMKKIALLFLLSLFNQIYSAELPTTLDDLTFNNIFFDMDQDYLYLPDINNRNIVIFHKNGDIQKNISINLDINGRINYFRKVSKGFLIYYNYTLFLIDIMGEILYSKSYPNGLIPTYIGVSEKYITISHPKIFNKDEQTEILDINTLQPLGVLLKKEGVPITFFNNEIVPIKVIEDNNDYFLIGGNKFLFWINYESKTLLKTDKNLNVVSVTNIKSDQIGFKSFIYLDNKIHTLVYKENSIHCININGDF